MLLFLLFLPLLLISTGGTPAFDGVNDTNPLHNFFEAIKSKIIINSLIKQIPPWYYLFIIFILFSKRRIEILCFLIFNLIIYFSIKPTLWGFAKYVMEYGVPFFILGHFILTKALLDKKKIVLTYLISGIIILLNIYDYYNFPKSNISIDNAYNEGLGKISKNYEKKTKYILKTPYNYNEAYSYIKKNNAKSNTLILGLTYGFLPQIIENYNYNELINVLNLKNNFDQITEVENSLSKTIMELQTKSSLKEKMIRYFGLINKMNLINKDKKNNSQFFTT